MPRIRLYASNAERQKAYRERKRNAGPSLDVPNVTPTVRNVTVVFDLGVEDKPPGPVARLLARRLDG